MPAFSNPRMILKRVWTGEGTGWVVISFLAGSERGISRGEGEAQPVDGIGHQLGNALRVGGAGGLMGGQHCTPVTPAP